MKPYVSLHYSQEVAAGPAGSYKNPVCLTYHFCVRFNIILPSASSYC